jgi:hypothetical protein
MAGRPKRRALQAVAAPLGEIPEALSGASTGTHDARAHERTGPRARPHPRPVQASAPGPITRGVADQTAGSELAELARLLRPGTTVRLERMRPSWCAGWLEDIELEAGGMRDLYDHVRNEWGGQRYRMQVLMPSGQVAFTSSLNISGPPLHEGRRIDRDEWEGYGSSSRRANPQAQQQRAPAKDDLTGILGVFKLIMDTQSESTKQSLESVRELVRNSAAQNQDLIEALANRDGERAGRTSLREQLGEIVEATQAIEGVRKVLGGGRQSNSREPNKDDPMQEALREATKHFIGGAMGSIFTRKQGSPAQRPPQGQRRMGPPPASRSGVRQGGIPDAVTGQGRPTHRN